MLDLIARRLAGPIASILCVILSALLVGQCTRAVKAESSLQKMQTTLERSKADLVTCKGNVKALDAARVAQNAAVERLRADGEARVAASKHAASQARAAAESYRRSAASILAAKPKSADRCEAAAILIAETVR